MFPNTGGSRWRCNSDIRTLVALGQGPGKFHCDWLGVGRLLGKATVDCRVSALGLDILFGEVPGG